MYPNETKEFNLRIWMDENTTIEDNAMEKTYIGKVSIVTSYQKIYQESILNGANTLSEGLIPVTINDDGEVKKQTSWKNGIDMRINVCRMP